MCSYSHISMILFLFSSISLLIATCVSKKSQKNPSTSRDDKSFKGQQFRSASAATSRSLTSDKSERGSSEKSTRRERNLTIDSLKVPRQPRQSSSSGKELRRVSSREGLKSETDSAKTEMIEVPLGKAAKDDPSNNILTPLSHQKASSITFQTNQVTFAHTLKRVRRRGIKPDDVDEKTAYIP